jgi:hypothetical protein
VSSDSGFPFCADLAPAQPSKGERGIPACAHPVKGERRSP